MKLMKRICSAILTLCMVFSMISGIAIPVSATEQSYREKYGMKYYQLFGTGYINFISPDRENYILNKAMDAYLSVLEDYEGGKDFLAKYNYALREGGITMFLNEGLALFGIRDSLKEEFDATATRMLAAEMSGDAALINDLTTDYQERLSIINESIDVTTDAGISAFQQVMKVVSEEFSDAEIDLLTSGLKNFGETINMVLPYGLNVADAWVSYLGLHEIQAGLLRRLKDLLPAGKSDLDDELDKLLNEIHKNAIENVADNFASDSFTVAMSQMLEALAKSIPNLTKALEEIAPKASALLEKVPRYGAWELGDAILKHGSYLFHRNATAESVYYTICLSSYVSEIGNALTQKKIEMIKAYQAQQPIGSKDIEDYEFLYSAYLSAIRATLDSALKTAKTKEKKQMVQDAITLMDRYSYDTYIDFCMYDLDNAILSGTQVELPECSGFPSACLKSEYPTNGIFKVSKDNANIMDRPCSKKTDMLAVLVEAAPYNSEYKVEARCENVQGNYWYKVVTSSGQTGYIYAGNGEYFAEPDVIVSGLSVPSTLTVGSRFWLEGSITAQNATLLTVSFNVYDANGKQRTGGTADVNGKSYVLDNSTIDTLTEFNILEAGTYKCELIATADAGISCEQITLYSGELLINTLVSNAGTLVAESADFVTRSDGVWLYPLPKENYCVNDWAGCSGNNPCYFHPEIVPGCIPEHDDEGIYGHNGIDLAGMAGQTPVYATAGGTLYCTNTNWYYRGITAVIEHPIGQDDNGTAWSYYSVYQHLANANTSNDGGYVNAGETIGTVGTTDGFGGCGQHLHFEILLGKSGQGYDLSRGTENRLYDLDNFEANGWTVKEGFKPGRILNNPALNSPAGTPVYNYGCEDTTRRHAGSVMYTFNPAEVSIGTGNEKEISNNAEEDTDGFDFWKDIIGAVVGDKIHFWKKATCTEPRTCKVCGEIRGESLGHDWLTTPCKAERTCKTCGATDNNGSDHNWNNATCTSAKTCTECGATEGTVLDHNWTEATCTTPKTCMDCKATEGSVISHNWQEATCITAKTCLTCGTTDGDALGHDWTEATYDAPKTCRRCKATEGETLTGSSLADEINKLAGLSHDEIKSKYIDPINEIYWMFASAWVDSVDINQIHIANGKEYVRVTDPRIAEYSTFKAYLAQYFPDETVDALLLSDVFINVDNMTYKQNVLAGFGSDPYIHSIQYFTYATTENSVVYCAYIQRVKIQSIAKSELTMDDLEEDWEFYILKKINGRWVFTSYPLIDSLCEELKETSGDTMLSWTESDTQRIMKTAGQIGAGGKHTVVLNPDGTAIAAGASNEGQCAVDGWNNLIAVAAGDFHTLGLRSDGIVIATGRNTDGQCDVEAWQNITMISAGDFHTVGVQSDGTVIATGRNNRGQCNVSELNQKAIGRKIIAVAAGYEHTVALYSDGTVYGIGSNDNNQISVSAWRNIVAIYAGVRFTVGLSSDGKVYATGENDKGQLNVDQWQNIAYLSAGDYHTIGVDRSGSIWSTGLNKDGQINVGGWNNVVAIGAGHAHTVALTSDGRILAVGSNSDNQLSIATAPSQDNSSTVASSDISLYIPMVKRLINEGSSGQGMLHDIDDDGVQELLVLYATNFDTSAGEAPNHLCSVFDIEYGKVVARIDAQWINSDAGMPTSYVGVVAYKGKKMLMTYAWLDGPFSGSGKTVLYDPVTFSVEISEKSNVYDTRVPDIQIVGVIGWGGMSDLEQYRISGMSLSKLLEHLR